MEDFSKYNKEGTSLRKAQNRLLEMLVEVDRICKKHNITYWIDAGNVLGAVRHGGFIPWDDDVDISMLKKDYKKLIKVLPNELPENYVLQDKKLEKYYTHTYPRIVDKNSLFDYGKKDPSSLRKKLKYQGVFIDIFYIEKGNLVIGALFDFIYRRPFIVKRISKKKYLKVLSNIIYPVSLIIKFLVRALYLIIPSKNYIYSYGMPIDLQASFRKNEILPTSPILFEGVMFPAPYDTHAYLTRIYGDYMEIPSKNKRNSHAESVEVYDID